MKKEKYAEYIENVEKSVSSNSKRFWSFVRSRSKTENIPPSVNFDDKTADPDRDIAELFNTFFQSVLTTQ